MKTRIAFACQIVFALALNCAALDKGYDTVEFSPAHLGGMQVKFNIILPRDYAASDRRFPVLYLLHGYTDDYSAWVTKSNLLLHAPAYEEIIVMPEGGTGWYMNNQGDKKLEWEDYLIQDLIPYVDSHYRTVATRQGRAIAGLSMGGYGAMTLGLRHPDLFAADLRAALAGGDVAAFQLRLKDVDDAAIARAADTLRPICQHRDVAFMAVAGGRSRPAAAATEPGFQNRDGRFAAGT